MVGYHLGKTLTEYGGVNRGVCRTNRDGLLESIDERLGIEKDGDGGRFSLDGGETWTHLPGNTLVSMNFWGFQHSFLTEAEARFPKLLRGVLEDSPDKGEVQLPLVIEDMLSRGRAQVRVLSSGETHREDKPAVVQALREKTAQGLYPENLWNV